MERLWLLDREAFRAVQSMRQPWLDPIVQAVTCTGLGWVQVLLILLLFVDWRMPSIKKVWAERLRPGSELAHRQALVVPLVFAYAASGLANTLVKRSIERERPSNFDWARPLEQVHYHSFSSGHTATSFGIAAALWSLTRGTSFASWGRWAWVWAAAVGFSRIYVGVHWPTDVLAGAMVGSAVGLWLGWLVRRPVQAG